MQILYVKVLVANLSNNLEVLLKSHTILTKFDNTPKNRSKR